MGHHPLTGVEEARGYTRKTYTTSHPHLITLYEDVPIPRQVEQEALHEIIVEQEGEHGFLELTGRLGRIRDHVLSIVDSGVVERGFLGLPNSFIVLLYYFEQI